MPGQHITQQQIRIYMEHRETDGQQPAAAKAGFSERSARRVDGAGGRLAEPVERHWRTRDDPFAGTWDEVVVPILEREGGKIQATAILRHLKDLDPGRYREEHLRTLQRRMSAWELDHGKTPEVIFRQDPVPGRQGLSDFTVANELEVTVDGQPLPHRIYHFRLAYSGWCHARVILGGESFAALAEGLREALEQLGGSPQEHRTDSLSAAFRNLTQAQSEDQTRRYAELMAAYGMKASRNNPGESHENGAIESSNNHLKRALNDALALRGSRDFSSLDEYRTFVERVVAGIRSRLEAGRLEVERAALKPLPAVPPSPSMTADDLVVRICTTSTCLIRKQLCSVPSRYIGQQLRVVIHDDQIDFFHQGTLILTTSRKRSVGNVRTASVDYRHVIESLVKKPGAFVGYQLRDLIHPNATWRAMWDALLAASPDARSASVVYLEALLLAYRQTCEGKITTLFAAHVAAGTLPTRDALREQFLPRPPAGPTDQGIIIVLPSAAIYDDLLRNIQHLTAANSGSSLQEPCCSGGIRTRTLDDRETGALPQTPKF